MTWLVLSLLSAVLLGLYDFLKKSALRDNAVMPVLFDSCFGVSPSLESSLMWVANRKTGLAIRISMSPAERTVAWCLLAAAVAANWVYVLATQHA